MDDNPELGDSIEALDTLATMGYLDKDSPSFGIALKWLHEGEESLSRKQAFLLNKDVKPIISKLCACGEEIELSALPNAYEEGKMLCSYHMYQYQKND